MDWNQMAKLLCSDHMILVYECVGCALLLVFLLRLVRKYKQMKRQMESDAEMEKKTKLDDLLTNRSKRGL